MFYGFIVHINDMGEAFCLKILPVYDSFLRTCYVPHGCDSARGYTLHRGPPQKHYLFHWSTPLSYTCNHTVKTYGGVEMQLRIF